MFLPNGMSFMIIKDIMSKVNRLENLQNKMSYKSLLKDKMIPIGGKQ